MTILGCHHLLALLVDRGTCESCQKHIGNRLMWTWWPGVVTWFVCQNIDDHEVRVCRSFAVWLEKMPKNNDFFWSLEVNMTFNQHPRLVSAKAHLGSPIFSPLQLSQLLSLVRLGSLKFTKSSMASRRTAVYVGCTMRDPQIGGQAGGVCQN